MTDTERVQWLQHNLRLHRNVELAYVVDGYCVTVLDEDENVQDYTAETLAEAIDLAALNTPKYVSRGERAASAQEPT